jgi:hypothetical protein
VGIARLSARSPVGTISVGAAVSWSLPQAQGSSRAAAPASGSVSSTVGRWSGRGSACRHRLSRRGTASARRTTMAALPPEAQWSQAVTRTASESPHLLAPEQMSWGRAPDASLQNSSSAHCTVIRCIGRAVLSPVESGPAMRVRAAQTPARRARDSHLRAYRARGRRNARSRGTRVSEPGGYALLPKEQFHFAWGSPTRTPRTTRGTRRDTDGERRWAALAASR